MTMKETKEEIMRNASPTLSFYALWDKNHKSVDIDLDLDLVVGGV